MSTNARKDVVFGTKLASAVLGFARPLGGAPGAIPLQAGAAAGLKAGRELSLARNRQEGRCRFPLPHLGWVLPRGELGLPRPQARVSQQGAGCVSPARGLALLGCCKKGRGPRPQEARAAEQQSSTRFCKPGFGSSATPWAGPPRQGRPESQPWLGVPTRAAERRATDTPAPPPRLPGSRLVLHCGAFSRAGAKRREKRGQALCCRKSIRGIRRGGGGLYRDPAGLREFLEILSLCNREKCSSREEEKDV